MEIVLAVIAGIVGLLVGGVINVLADDLPARQNPRLPHYPDGTPRPVSAWLGIGAFLTGQRQSPRPPEETPAAPMVAEETDPDAEPPRPISRFISWRHPLVEIVMALMFSGMALAFREERNLPFWFVYVAILVLIAVIDIEHRLILFVVILPACLFALLVAIISPEQDKPLSEFLIGGLAGFGVFFIMFLGGGLFSAATKNDEIAFGFGDVMLATLSGLILGWRAFIFASMITVFAGAAGALLYLIIRAIMRRHYQLFTPLPYGPYIVLGTLIMLLFRDEVREFFQGGM